jgi:P27 family predicted phage terminase small subunit
MLAILAELLVVQQRAARVLNKSAILVESSEGRMMRNPAAIVLRDAASLARLYAQEFGLTPSARAAIRLAEGERDELDDLLG